MTGSDGIFARLLKSCTVSLAKPLQYLFNRSLQIGKVPTLWKTSVEKKTHPKELNDYRPVTLTFHLMKTLKRVLMRYLLKPQVRHALDPIQFAYQENMGVENANLYLLHRVPLERGWLCVENHFF